MKGSPTTGNCRRVGANMIDPQQFGRKINLRFAFDLLFPSARDSDGFREGNIAGRMPAQGFRKAVLERLYETNERRSLRPACFVDNLSKLLMGSFSTLRIG